MKKLLLLLLLANAGFYAWSRWGYQAEQPEPPHAELAASHVTLLKPEGIPASQAEPASVQSPASELPASEVAVAEPPASIAVPQQVCMQWTQLDDAGWRSLRPRLQAARLQPVSARSEPFAEKYWVYIPPLGDKTLVEKKVEQLRSLGVTDLSVIEDKGRWDSAISLGIFSSKEAADHHLEALKNQGVKSAQVRPRDPVIKRWTLLFTKLDEAGRDSLKALSAEWPGSRLQVQPCP
ncbi:SPOR domain-containing protein [Leeia sp.]|uniref:SPOR domain-containing protein n=1 Tax=Leeia sp. TaxID=2884678 RepID=UPI0035B21EDB